MADYPQIETEALPGTRNVMKRLEEAGFRKSSSTGQYANLPHEYIMSHYSDAHLVIWFQMRHLIALYGQDRPFFKSKKQWRYLDMPDGYSYWVMPDWVSDDWESKFIKSDNYVLNRMLTKG